MRVLLLLIAVTLIACGDDGSESPDVTDTTQTPLATTAAVATSTAFVTRVSGEEPAVDVTGLFEEPRGNAVIRETPLQPKPPGETWDGESTMLYDTQTRAATNLGRGTIGRFSPDGTRMVWVAVPERSLGSGEVWLLDIASGERRMLGEGRLAQFVDDGRVGVTSDKGNEIIDLATRERETIDRFPNIGEQFIEITPDGYELRQEYASEYPYPASTWFLTDRKSNRLLLKFEAFRAVPAGRGALAVATSLEFEGEPDASGNRNGTTNVFLVDIASGGATFIATAGWSRLNWPLAANESYVAWTPDFCADEQGLTTLYDRRSGQMRRLSASLWVLGITDENLLIAGAFGPKELIDLEQNAYRYALAGAGDTTGTADYGYISAGTFGGHGGLCP